MRGRLIVAAIGIIMMLIVLVPTSAEACPPKDPGCSTGGMDPSPPSAPLSALGID